MHLPRTSVAAAAALLAMAASGAPAQEGAASFGITGAGFSWRDGRREQALGAVLQLAPARWLTLGATPTLLRAAGPDESTARVGMADLPLFVGVVHGFAAPWSPTIGVAGVASLPTGDASRGLGRGVSVMSAEGALALSPAPVLTARAGASRVLRVGDAAPRGMPTTSLFGDMVLLAGARTNVSAGYALELRGDAPAGYEPARAVSAAVVRTLAGRTAVMASATRSLRGAGPEWSLAVGVGTA
ncbi:MAG TPA: hypothetical protein VFS05_15300, partial [Gemmatimonadaceae bacterium]|nr:hypothetical protein [Gemmatimonadaceae bacterium]